jgi:hypothetical protein
MPTHIHSMEPNPSDRAHNARGSKRSSEVRGRGSNVIHHTMDRVAKNKRVRLQPSATSTISDGGVLVSDVGGIETGPSTLASATGAMDVVMHPLVEGIMALYQSLADDAVPHLPFSSCLLLSSYPVSSIPFACLHLKFSSLICDSVRLASRLFASVRLAPLLFSGPLCHSL